MTEAQAIRLGKLIGETGTLVRVDHKPFDLPNGYVWVAITYGGQGGNVVVYGIDQEGAASS